MFLLEGDKLLRLEVFGEDTCELLETVEASFGVKFTEDDLVRAVDVRALADCVCRKLVHPVSERCLSSATFYGLRREFVSLFKVRRADVNPQTSLAKLLPWKVRKGRWRRLQDHLRYALPTLGMSYWELALSIVLVAVLFTLPTFGWHKLASYAGSMSGLFTVLGALCMWVVVLVLLSPLARKFPRGCETFGDLTRLTLARNYGIISAEYGVSSDQEVLDLLCRLIAAEEGLDIRKVTPETLFPEGLNIY
ncbi:MAG: hypothetical protein WA817_00760 [Candidatus Acidiferrum sp.]